MKIDARVDAAEAARWKLVRTDSFEDFEPESRIVTADEATGDYSVVRKDGTVVNGCRGSLGLRIAPRAFHVDC